MGWLYDARQKIEKAIDEKKLDPVKVKGAIGLKAGFLISMISQSTADDPAKADKLKKAAQEVLGLSL